MTVVDWIGLAPPLVCAVGVLLLVSIQRLRVVSRFSGVAGIVFLCLSLGTIARLWALVRHQPLSFSIDRWSAPAALNVSFRVDLVDVACLVACFLAAFPILARSEPKERDEPAFCLAFLALAGALFAINDSALLAVAWTAIHILTTARLIARQRFSEGIKPLAFALFGAPLLLAAAAALSSLPDLSRASPAVTSIAAAALAVVGAASAGLGPFRQVRAVANASPNLDVVNDLVLPLVGFDLVLRALTSTSNTLPAWFAGLLVVIGFSGIVEAADAAHKVANLADLVRACNRANFAMAFAALALGSASAISAALFLVTVSIIAQAIALAEPAGWRVHLGLGSVAGFPPLPGFLGRWAIVGVALSAGSWPLAVAVAVAIAVTSVGFWRSLARLNLARPVQTEPDQKQSGAGILFPVAAIIGASLAPGQWLIATVLPAAALSGKVVASPSLAESLVGLILVILPILFAASLVRYPEHARRTAGRSRLPHRAARWTIEPAEALAAFARQIEDRYGLAVGILIAVGTILALVT